jgi:hypothetical protein
LNPGFSGKLGKGMINPLAALETIYSAAIPSGNYANLTLVPENGDLSAHGNAEKVVTGPSQQFLVTAWGLNARSTYRLLINGKDITSDTLVANNFGGLSIELSNQPASESDRIHLELPLEFNPITEIKHVELREGDRTVLEGDFFPIADGMGSDQFIMKRASLSSTGLLSKAAGKANVFVSRKREDLRVEGNSLTPGDTYIAFADGVNLGIRVAQTATTRSGFVRLRLTGDGANEYRIPATLKPLTNIKHIELRDSSNRVILQGDFLPGGDG